MSSGGQEVAPAKLSLGGPAATRAAAVAGTLFSLLSLPLPAAAATAAAAAAAAAAAHVVIPGVLGDDSLREGFVSSLLLIFFSELGDKTFFIALLLARRLAPLSPPPCVFATSTLTRCFYRSLRPQALQNSRGAVFAGTYGALAVMTVRVATSIPPASRLL